MKKNYSLIALNVLFSVLAITTFSYHAWHYIFDEYPWGGWTTEPAHTIASIVGGQYWFVTQPILYLTAIINGRIQSRLLSGILKQMNRR